MLYQMKDQEKLILNSQNNKLMIYKMKNWNKMLN